MTINSCHLDRSLNVEIDDECQIFVMLSFLIAAEFYNLGHIQGIIRVLLISKEIIFSDLYYFQI